MDETKVTPDQEVKEVKVEGTVEAEIEKTEPKEVKESKAPDTVPLAVYLDLKEDVKNLKHEIKEAKSSSRSSVEVQGLAELANKYPDVNSEFMADLLNSATKEATRKIEEKYTPIIEKQEAEKKREAFDKAFDNLYEKTLQENPDLPKNIDKDAIKELALTPKFRNVPLSDILLRMYKTVESGKSSSENEARTSSDKVEDIVSFDKITSDQKKNIMADPKARQKYFNWLDTQTGR